MQSRPPVRIGCCLSLTGALAGNARSARLAHEIWREDVNRTGGLLGRPVELICYDTANFAPVLDAVAASDCDVLFLCSYLEDSIALVRALRLRVQAEDVFWCGNGPGCPRPKCNPDYPCNFNHFQVVTKADIRKVA